MTYRADIRTPYGRFERSGQRLMRYVIVSERGERWGWAGNAELAAQYLKRAAGLRPRDTWHAFGLDGKEYRP